MDGRLLVAIGLVVVWGVIAVVFVARLVLSETRRGVDEANERLRRP